MLIREFEGKTEQEAIEKAIEELHIEREDFDVEVLDPGKKGLFKKTPVKIRIHINGLEDEDDSLFGEDGNAYAAEEVHLKDSPKGEVEEKTAAFIEGMIQKMGYDAQVLIDFRRDGKIGFEVVSANAPMVIGHKGATLDAIQLIANVIAGDIDPAARVIVDCESYRNRHEQQMVRNARRIAEQVRKTGRSRLLDPMNPFERRLVHTALADVSGITTKSEGEGVYKQIRIIPLR